MLNHLDIQQAINKYYNPKDKTSEMFYRLYKDTRLQHLTTMGIEYKLEFDKNYYTSKNLIDQ